MRDGAAGCGGLRAWSSRGRRSRTARRGRLPAPPAGTTGGGIPSRARGRCRRSTRPRSRGRPGPSNELRCGSAGRGAPLARATGPLRDDGRVKVSTRGDYAARALLSLALHESDRPTSVKEIAERTNLPQPYLEQILLAVKGAGRVRSKRGVGGGYVLARDPDEITLAEILAAVDGPLTTLVDEHDHCEGHCILQEVWVCVSDEMRLSLGRYTLADLAGRARVGHRRPAAAAGSLSRRPPGSAAVGRRTVTSSPPVVDRASETVPASDFTSCCTIASPRPEPPSRACPVSPQKQANARAIAASDIPGPASATSTITHRPSSWADSDTSVWGGATSSALFRRLSSACSRRPGVARAIHRPSMLTSMRTPRSAANADHAATRCAAPSPTLISAGAGA